MDLLHIFSQMLIIFGMVLVGFFAAKRNIWSSNMDRPLSIFIMNISLPALILGSVMGEGLHFERAELYSLVFVAIVNYAVILSVALLLPKVWHVHTSRQGLLRFMVSFGNVGFIGYPICDAVFGPKAVFYASVLNIPFNLLCFTIGVSFINGGKVRQAFSPRLICSPCVIASVLALIIALLGISTPTIIGDWFHLMGNMTVPCSLFIIGSTLSHIAPRDMAGSRFVYGVSFFRLLFVPLLVGVVLHFLGFDAYVTSVAMVLSGMPVATNGIMLCLQYGRDERVMAQGLFITTFLAMLTIPLLALLTSYL